MTGKGFVLIIIGFVVALVAAAAFFLMKPTVVVARPQRGVAVDSVYATGTVEPTVMLPIVPRVSARISRLLVEEGQKVPAGAALAELESEEFRQALADAKSREDFLLAEYERQTRLHEGKVAAREAFERSRSEWESAKAQRHLAESRLQYLTLQSPNACEIIKRDGEIGQFVQPSDTVFWLSCSDTLRISAEIDEEDISRIIVGQKVLIRGDAFPEEVFNGVVQSITPKGDPIARSYRVRISFAGSSPMRIGMTAENNILIRETANALLVPAKAVQKDSVWVVVDGKVRQQQVTIGARGLEQFEILSGLTDEVEIVVDHQKPMTEGQAVRVVPSAV